MTCAHSGEWGGKNCAGKGTAEVVIRIAVSPGKKGTGEPKNRVDSSLRSSPRQQMPGDPQIHDAPVRLGKAFENAPALHTSPVDGGGLRHFDWVRLIGCGVDEERRDRVGWWWCIVPDTVQQRLGVWRQAGTGVHDSHPRSVPVGGASCGLLVGEAGEAPQVPPVRAGRIAAIQVRQALAGGGRHRRFQRRGAEANPSLQTAGAGLQHYARIMPVGTHGLHDLRTGAIQVDQNVTSVLVSGVGLNVDIESLAVADAQKPNAGCIPQLRLRPKSFSGKRSPCLMVNQTQQIQLVRHSRNLASDGVPGQKESAVVHHRNLAIATTRRTMIFQRTANSVLTFCLSPGGRFMWAVYATGRILQARAY